MVSGYGLEKRRKIVIKNGMKKDKNVRWEEKEIEGGRMRMIYMGRIDES